MSLEEQQIERRHNRRRTDQRFLWCPGHRAVEVWGSDSSFESYDLTPRAVDLQGDDDEED